MNTVEFDNYPAPMYLPEMHIPGGGVPQMGNHWINLLSPELNGATFTNTFIYGSYDGAVTFFEPMLTRDWWMAQTNTVVPIAVPQAYQQDGYYPVSYTVKHTSNPDTYSISMQLTYQAGQ
jgi:hypothetical protein